MALLWIESFDGFRQTNGAVGTAFGKKYVTSTANQEIDDGHVGGKSIRLGSADHLFTTPILTTDDTLTVGFAFKYNASSADRQLVSLMDGTTRNINVRLKSSDEFGIYRGNTLLASTSGFSIGSNVWAYFELTATTNNSTGSYQLRINGVEALSATSVDTQDGSNAYSDRVRFEFNTTECWYDDIYVLDGSGSVNNAPLGPRKVVAIVPDADGNYSQWTPAGTGSNNFDRVTERPPDDDTSYVESSTPTEIDTNSFSAVSIGEINGIQINTYTRVTDASPFDIDTVIRSGGSDYDDGGNTIGNTAYNFIRHIAEVDPDTSSAWTASGINNAEFGFRVG